MKILRTIFVAIGALALIARAADRDIRIQQQTSAGSWPNVIVSPSAGQVLGTNGSNAVAALAVTGTGNVVKGTNPTLVGATQTGPDIEAYPAMSGTTVDITKPGQTYSATGDISVDVSAALAAGVEGQAYVLDVFADGTARTISFTSCYSINLAAARTSFVVPASGEVRAKFVKLSGSVILASGDPVPISALTSGTPTASDLFVFSQSGATKQAALSALPLEHSVSFSVTGNGAALTTGVQDIIVNTKYSGTLTSWSVTVSPADTITFDILRSADGGAAPSASIVGGSGTKPNVASGVNAHSTTFTSWTSTAITAYDNFKCEITAVGGTATSATVTLFFR